MLGLGDIKSMCKTFTKIKALLDHAQKKKKHVKEWNPNRYKVLQQ